GRVITAERTGLTLAFDEGSGWLRRASVTTGGLDVAMPRDGGHARITEGRGDVTFSSTGVVTAMRAEAGRFEYSRDARALVASGLQVSARFDAAGLPAEVTGRAARVEYRRPDGTFASTGAISLTAEGVNGALRRLVVGGSDLRYDDPNGTLTAAGGQLEATFDGGALDVLRVGANGLRYSGTAEGGHPMNVDVERATAELTRRAEGGARLAIETGAGRFDVNGHRVSLERIEGLVLETTPKGEIDTFQVRLPGRGEFVDRDGDLRVLTRDAGASWTREGSTLRLDFAEVDVALKSEGLSANVVGGAALVDDRLLKVEVREAHVLRELGAQLDVHVEALTLSVSRTAAGALDELSLSLGALDARIGAMDVFARTPTGERVRLHVTAGVDGETIKEAFLQIPTGGEVRLSREDLDVRFGGQLIRFTHGDDGIYRLRGEGLDVSAKTRDAEVKVTGGDAQVSLDPATGRLVIDEIRGTRVDVKAGGVDVHVELEEVRGFVARMTKLEGSVTGGALHLVPTGDGSRLTAEVRAEVSGIPLVLSVRDARELEALGALSTNQVHVLVRDPSGHGDLHVGAGPIDLRGSAIELVGRYHPYDAARMTEAVHGFVTTGGAPLFSGVTFEPDGALRLGTNREGLNGELAVLLPRTSALPGYRLDLSTAPSSAPGVIGSLGYRSGDVTASVFAGLVPGSHATLHVKEGQLSVGGVPMPERTDLPTTVVGGARLDLGDVAGGHLGLVAGAYANPAGLASSPFISEKTPYGGFGGLEYSRGRWSLSGSAVVDVKDGRAELGGAMLRLGIRF
ncbi:hypothetical protein L6R52_02575, partial [Myxococcota bacterium]|nr:hypothetical protein [Myxococcota bacterium]